MISTQLHSNISCEKFDNLINSRGDGIICSGAVDGGISDSGGIIVKDVRQSNCAAEYFQGEGQQIVLTRSDSWGSKNI